MALAEARGGDANELRVALQFRNAAASAVAHASPQAADELMDHCGHAALVGNPPFDALRNQLVGGAARVQVEVVLEIPVAAAPPHGADRSHPAIVLEAAPLIENQLARTLVGAR